MPAPGLEATVFAPLVLPVCFYVAFCDLKTMRIPNHAVGLLAVTFGILGGLLLPPEAYLWRWAQLGIVLAVGIVLNIAGGVGAGDVKFAAVAALFVPPEHVRPVLALLATVVLAGYAAHRIAAATPLRRLAPEWESWHAGRRFPFGLPLGGTLAFYLAIAALSG